MADTETLAVYAAQVEKYEALGMSQTQIDSIIAFLARLAPGARLLDLGCGPGLHSEMMMQQGFEVHATDATPEFVAAAQAKGINATVATFDDLSEVAAYDAIWASFSLLHAPKSDMPKHLAAIARALRPGGWFFLGTKLGEGEYRDSIGRFYAYYSEAELTDLLATAGFTIADTYTGTEAGLSGEVAPFILIHARRQNA